MDQWINLGTLTDQLLGCFHLHDACPPCGYFRHHLTMKSENELVKRQLVTWRHYPIKLPVKLRLFPLGFLLDLSRSSASVTP